MPSLHVIKYLLNHVQTMQIREQTTLQLYLNSYIFLFQ